MLQKRLADENGDKSKLRLRDVDAAIRRVIGGAVEAGEVIDLFAAVGFDAARLDILSDGFLRRVSALEEKNLALETLRKLLNDQVRVTETATYRRFPSSRSDFFVASFGSPVKRSIRVFTLEFDSDSRSHAFRAG